ncbi:MAG: peptide/nickel transport system ATP-binding protein [Bradymonadia bacterium]|jgi:peptide/nickel transport system ATP-binding protein
MSLLALHDLRVAFNGIEVVSGITLQLGPGETVAIVGESGCGKSVTARAILDLLPRPPATVSGRVEVDGASIYEIDQPTLQTLRGERVGFVFQNAGSALNPVHPVGRQISERLRRHRGLNRRAAHLRTVELLGEVGIPDPEARARSYPHELSGGMRQRVVIAIALACDPDLLIADEPTTALDVTIQAQVLALILERCTARGMGLLLISHDLGVVAQTVDRVVVMYAGQIVEDAPVASLFDAPRHPYTRGLLDSMPAARVAGDRLSAIPGTVPSPRDFPVGCRFQARCAFAQPDCDAPVALTHLDDRAWRCRHPQ